MNLLPWAVRPETMSTRGRIREKSAEEVMAIVALSMDLR
jgi:hypothetical protein